MSLGLAVLGAFIGIGVGLMLAGLTGRTVLALLHELSHELSQTVLLVTHNASIARMADRVLRMRDGRIVADERNEAPAEAEALEW